MDSITDFAEGLRRIGLLEPEQQAAVDRELTPRFTESRALVRELVQRGWLTAFQANRLAQGRGAELRLGSYVLLELLAEGGMGQVYKARHSKFGRIVALKVIHKTRLSNSVTVKRFHRELRAAAQLDHPNIVHALDADEANGLHFLVMEYVEGENLSRLVGRQGPLPILDACDYIRQAALGLQHAHEKGMVHRDIKPSNLLVTSVSPHPGQGNGKDTSPIAPVALRVVVKILDFGLARISEPEGGNSLTALGVILGTPDFIAPEQARNTHTADVRADIYSLGCSLYFLLTGKPPFPKGTVMEKLLNHQLDEPTPVEQLRPEVPPALAEVVRKLMAKRPEDRYQLPADAARALEPLCRPAEAIPVAKPAQKTVKVAKVPLLEVPRATPVALPVTAARVDPTVVTPVVARAKAVPVAVALKPRRLLPRTRAGVAWMVGLALVVGVVAFAAYRFTFATAMTRPEKATTRSGKLPPAKGPVDDAWLAAVAALPAAEQVEAVAAKLKAQNADFDGSVRHKIENGVVTELEVTTDNVTDISPLRGLSGLKRLSLRGSSAWRGKLADLEPLKGMSLVALDVSNTKVTDLAPLRGMQLEEFAAADCSVSDLDPLKDAKLQVADLGMTRVANLSPLRNMPLRELRLQGTRVRDLGALRRSKVQKLDLHRTQVTDLGPLAGSQLQSLDVGEAPVRELTPLADVPLREIQCSLNPWRDPDVLHRIKTLKTINGRNAATVLQEIDGKRQAFDTWAKSVSEMPAEKQAEAVGKKLKEANFNFDGKVEPVVSGGIVTELRFVTDAVEDISAVRALAGLKKLSCGGSDKGRGHVADLWPLHGLPLTHLQIDRTQVSDLTALRGMPLESLSLHGTAVPDLSPLVDSPLRSIDGDFALGRDGNTLRKMKMLETINGKPAGQFLK